MIVLSAAILLFGIFPGLPLRAIANIQQSLGLQQLEMNLSSVPAEVGELNMLVILAALAVALAIPFVIFVLCRRSKKVPQSDTYAAGSYAVTDKYHYSAKFYERAYAVVERYLRDRVDDFYYWVVDKAEGFFEEARKIYTGNVSTYVAYIVLLLALMIVLKFGGHF
jgi:NADH-quinone oxidoreductase subunit M